MKFINPMITPPKKGTIFSMKKLKELLYSHDVAIMPNAMARTKNIIIGTEIVSTAILDLFSFSIKGAQSALAHNMNVLAFILIILYFMREVLQTSVRTFSDSLKTEFNKMSDTYITEHVSDIANTVRGKVFKRNEGENYSTLMTNPEVNLNLKDYISYVWQFWQKLPGTVANGLTALIMAIAILVTELIQTKDAGFTVAFSAVLIGCIFVFIFLFKMRFSVKKKYKKPNKELRKKNEVVYNDIKNIEPLIKKEYFYRVSLLKKILEKTRVLEKKMNFSLNILSVFRNITLAIFMIIIIVIKVNYSGGIASIDAATITDILAISAVYSTILDKIASLLQNLEDNMNILKDIEVAKNDIDNIMKTYYKEISKEVVHTSVERIQINPFEFSYPGALSVYNLVNKFAFTLEKGRSYLAYGETGCGKSTFMHLISGKIYMDESPISYGSNGIRAYLSSIMHESDGTLGSSSILDEITFGEEPVYTKLVQILKGVKIYDDIKRNLGLTEDDDIKVVDYLSKTTCKQYSQGQKQRISICKVLYNLNQDHQIVVFDEATNALDDTTAEAVLNYIINFCQKETDRIVIFVSHQVELTRKLTNGEITFKQKCFPSFEIEAHV